MPLNRQLLVATFLLTLVAAVPRLYDLGSLSFYADEETTAMPARALAAGEGWRMPSGMEYRRALPFTWVNAGSARLLGDDREVAYRLPTAIFGTATVPLLFLTGTPLVGAPSALVAAALLAVSEWHIVFSRQARMYAPFLFFHLAAAYLILQWSRTGRRRFLLGGIASFAMAVSLHGLAIVGAAFALLALAFRGWSRVPPAQLLAFFGVGALGSFVYERFYVSAAFARFGSVSLPDFTPPPGSDWLTTSLGQLQAWMVIPILASAALAGWAATKLDSGERDPGWWVRSFARYAGAVLGGALLGAGQLYGAAMAGIVILLFADQRRFGLLRRARLPLALLALVAAGWLVGAVAAFGPVRGLRLLLTFPFPYPLVLFGQFPGVILLFAGTAVWLAVRARPGEHPALRILSLAVLLILLGIGGVSAWGGTRYLFPVYPFLLLVAAAGLVTGLQEAARRSRGIGQRAAVPVALVIVAAGVLGEHGVPVALRVATLEHGVPVNEATHMYPFRPDHRGAGEFVRSLRAAGDVVIAEDPLQQHWYAGGVDYWFRGLADSHTFLRHGEEGELRDIYVDSRLAGSPAVVDSLARHLKHRVWLITSGETYTHRSYYLDPDQLRWLDSLEASHPALFEGHDGVTRVYCLNCPGGTPERIGSGWHEAPLER